MYAWQSSTEFQPSIRALCGGVFGEVRSDRVDVQVVVAETR